MAERLKLSAPMMCARACFNTNQAGRQSFEELQHLRAANAFADHHRAINIHAMNLKHQLRNIETNRANLAHGRLPSMWLRFDAITLWHLDAAEWVPSTTSKPEELKVSITSPLSSGIATKRLYGGAC